MDCDLHSISNKGFTPLFSITHEYDLWKRSVGEQRTPPLHRWLACLHTNDIDLYEYGKRECDLLSQGLTSGSVWCEWRGSDGIWHKTTAYISRFTYGPLPTDWDIVIEDEDPITEPDKKIPGGWVDETDGSDDDQSDLESGSEYDDDSFDSNDEIPR